MPTSLRCWQTVLSIMEGEVASTTSCRTATITHQLIIHSYQGFPYHGILPGRVTILLANSAVMSATVNRTWGFVAKKIQSSSSLKRRQRGPSTPEASGIGHPTGSALQVTESEMISAVLDADETLVVVFDNQGRIEQFNRACEKLTGYTRGEVQGKLLGSVLLIEEEVESVMKLFEATVTGQFPSRNEHHLRTRDGQRRWVAWSNTAIRDNIGRIKNIVGVGVDMTERHPDGKALMEGQARLSGIIDSAMDAIVSVDAQQHIKLFNRAAEKMFRCPASQAIGQPLNKFIPQQYHASHREHIEKFGNSQVSDRSMGAQRPIKAVRADGEEFLIEASISQVEVGGTKLFTAVVRDVTVRHQAAEALRAAEARFRTIYDNAAVGIMMIEPQGNILQANLACEKLLGYTAAELNGLSYMQITHPDDVKRTTEHTKPVTQGITDRDEYEKRYVTKEGKRVWARVIFSVVRDNSNQPQYFIKLVEDITRRKRSEAHARRTRAANAVVLERLGQLTDREREVLWLMVDGQATKVIAMELGTSPKTIDVHRGRVMEKMHAESVAQLVQMMMPVRKMPEAAAGQPRD